MGRPEGAALWTPGQGAALTTRQGRCPWTPRRAFGPLDTHAGSPAQGRSFAGVTARNGRAATRELRLAAAAAERVPRLRAQAEGFAVIVASLSTSAFGGLATGEASPSALLRGTLSVVTEGSLLQYHQLH